MVSTSQVLLTPTGQLSTHISEADSSFQVVRKLIDSTRTASIENGLSFSGYPEIRDTICSFHVAFILS